MILRQFLHTTPTVAISYLVGCGGKAACAVVDPVSEPSFYLEAAAAAAMEIRFVIDTHVHADHLSTGRGLASAANAPYVLHRRATAAGAWQGVAGGERLELGNVLLEVLDLPGHTPEHLGLLVADRTRSADPWFVLSGHTLMVGDMGRTELASAAEEGAAALFASAERLRQLPDHVAVLPGAFAGSVCGRGLSGTPMSTIGFERRRNRAFAITDRQEFIAAMLRDIPSPPPNAAAIRRQNLTGDAVVA